MQTTKQNMSLEDALNIFHARNYAYDILRRFFIEEPSKEYLKPFIYQKMIELFFSIFSLSYYALIFTSKLKVVLIHI